MNAPDGAPQKIRLDTQRSKYDVICHLLSSGCAEPCLFLGTDAYLPYGPSPPRWGRIFCRTSPRVIFCWRCMALKFCQPLSATKCAPMSRGRMTPNLMLVEGCTV